MVVCSCSRRLYRHGRFTSGSLAAGSHFGTPETILKFSRWSSEKGGMNKLLQAFGLSSDSFWTWVCVVAFGLILVRIFLDAATPRRAR